MPTIPPADFARILELTAELQAIAVRTGAYLQISATSYQTTVTFHAQIGTMPDVSDRAVILRTEHPGHSGHSRPFVSTSYQTADGIGLTVYTALVIEPVSA